MKLRHGLLWLGCLGAPLLFAPSLLQAEPVTAVADNGREVLLKDNGEWEYVSDDLYATTPDGKRIRLMPNQQWEAASERDAPAYQPVPQAIKQPLRQPMLEKDVALVPLQNAAETLQLKLHEVHIENHRETVAKNTRLRSNIVFYIDSLDGGVSFSPEDFFVQDSRGRDYAVFSAVKGIQPVGGQPGWVIRAKGAPRWWGVKFFSLQIKPNAIGNTGLIELRKPMNEVIKKNVSELPEDDES